MGIFFPRASTGDKLCVFTQISEQNSTKNKGTQVITMKVAFAVCLLAIFVQGSNTDQASDEVDDFVAWVGKDGKDGPNVKQCDTTPGDFNAKQECVDASRLDKNSPHTTGDANDKQAAWQPMCDALLNYTCEAGTEALTDAINNAAASCGGCDYPSPADQNRRRRDKDTKTTVKRNDCCAQFISEETPPATTTAKPANPTVVTKETTAAPGPGPTLSSTSKPGDKDTTTMESTESSTEGGSDSDSAINIGASGLLVTLITMMAAGVNIA